MYVTIKGPATWTESDDSEQVYLLHEAKATKEFHVDSGNPNIDAYFNPDYVMDHQFLTVNGNRWMLETAEATVSLDLTVNEAIECATVRASEDYTTAEDVLERWSRYDAAPRSVKTALERVRDDEQ